MRTALEILKRDLLALVKNPIALLVVGALLVLPGLYAWYCIIANWNPYGNTGAMPVAIVNEDKGATNSLAGDVNIGEQVMDAVEGNEKIGWKIYDNKEEALRDTELCLVYATIVLPEDLSKNVVGIFEGSDNVPTVYYYPNEKYNAVATKVTDSAAQTLVRQINQGFSSTVNKKILESAQGINDKVEQQADKTNKSAIGEIKQIRQDLDKVVVSLDDAQSAIAGWREAARGASSALGVAGGNLPGIAAALGQSGDQLETLRTQTDEFEGRLSASILKSSSALADMAGKTTAAVNTASADLKTVKADLEAIMNAATSTGDADLESAAAGMSIVVSLLDGVVTSVDGRVSEMSSTVEGIANSVSGATNRISGEVMPQLSSGGRSLATALAELSGAINQFGPEIEGLRSVLAETDSALDMASTSIADAKTLLGVIGKNLEGTTNDIGAIGKALEIEELTKLLKIDPENAGTFVSTPVQMVTEKVFPVSNYGTAVAPFYTNLALWIGCFILVSLMKVEVTGFPGSSARQRYFGRLLLFLILSLLQSQAICGVDILLGIDCANPALFMLAGAVCSFAYMNLIYALVKAFRNIGKTLCIFLLIMQVPGSSGMYPIQMMPGYFQFIHPALPFTYGIDAMREALSGLYGMAYVSDLCVLAAIVPGALLIGLGVRRFMANLLLMFDQEMNKVGFFASEEYVAGMENSGMLAMMRALRANPEYADDIEERAWRFRRVFPHLKRTGSIALFAIPFALLVIMLPINLASGGALPIDVKLTALIIMLVVLFVVQIGLTVLEYTNRNIEEETKLIGASILSEEFGLDLAAGAPAADGAAPASGMLPAGAASQAKAPYGGPARDLFATDMKLGSQSIIGVVVITLLVITPSMYAWFNIAGSWDPYSATGNLKVAVANEDEGYKGDLLPITINIGNTMESQLRGNSNFDWVFVNDGGEAVSGVKGSEYYAAIVIPHDFSANMLTYLTDDTAYPNVLYYTNEKENPIAPIITQKGADSIQESIRVSFTERVDEVALGLARDVLEFVKNPNMTDYVSKMSRHLDDALGDAKSASTQLRSLGSLMNTTSAIVLQLGATLDGLKVATNSARAAATDAKAGAGSASAAFDEALAVVRDIFGGQGVDFDRLQEIINSALDLLQAGADTVPGSIDERIAQFQDLASKEGVSEAAKKQADALVADLQKAKDHANTAIADVANARTQTDAIIADTQAELDDAKAYFNNTVEPSVASLRSTLSEATAPVSEIVDSLDSAVSGLGGSTDGLSGQLTTISNGLAKAGDKLQSSAANIEDVKKRVAEALRSGDLKQIESVILGGDTEAMAASLAAPIKLDRQPFFPIANYGSAMAPFYTVLSLWVGALVMISTMRVRVVEERIEELRSRYAKVRPRHEFFGRYGVFGFIGFMQSVLVLLGDLFLLHIQCVNPVMFVLVGVIIGQLFCLIVYTIVELFGDVGKALCVILLVMQVAASGGTFPVEMLDPLLTSVSNFLPFYYAMSALQECVAGISWVSLAVQMGALLLMAGAMLVIALPLRRPFRKLNIFFEEQLEKTGYM